jgi:hypothetical protein
MVTVSILLRPPNRVSVLKARQHRARESVIVGPSRERQMTGTINRFHEPGTNWCGIIATSDPRSKAVQTYRRLETPDLRLHHAIGGGVGHAAEKIRV